MSGTHIRIGLHHITDGKRLENEIMQTKILEATALFAVCIAHDFNNLLALIVGMLEVLNNPEAKFVKVLIQDQGAGIPWEVLTQVFDPYFSSKNLWNKKSLGLGLTVTYSILKKHGGAIDITSRQDAGTTVSMYLPAIDRQIINSRQNRII